MSRIISGCAVGTGFTGGSDGKASDCKSGDLGSIPGSGRYLGEGNGNSLQYSCLGDPMDGGAWQATVHRVSKVIYNLATKPPPPCYWYIEKKRKVILLCKLMSYYV